MFRRSEFRICDSSIFRRDGIIASGASSPLPVGDSSPDQTTTLAAINRLVRHPTVLEINVEGYRRCEAVEVLQTVLLWAKSKPPMCSDPQSSLIVAQIE